LTRAYVEQDLADVFDGQVRYARDAFEGLRLMDAFMDVKRGVAGAQLPPLRQRRVKAGATLERTPVQDLPARSDVAADNPVPSAPFLGERVVKGVPLAEYAAFLDERATFMGQWGLKGARGGDGPSYQELVESEGRPRLRMWLERLQTENLLQAAVVYGYFPCVSQGDDLIILDERTGNERTRFTFPRQRRDRHLCLSDFFRAQGSGEVDVVAFQVATMGSRISAAAGELFAKNAYRDYLELHGLSVQLTEALAEYWHARVRGEWGIGGDESLADMLKVNIAGCRYSFGYPACPNLEDQRQLFELLDPSRIGVELSEEFQLHPEQSTSALIVHHPEAKYFNV
ncbi:vitamin B12 dependent-methionine synthase activation domain-containing protein, partial [Sphaerisporangium melleum]|uniref:vitamin B12 dependent-methionine synthase activation domain-containing protein n=1 Tax=Sphaerisporangium melleum TaxID=321316 RepID=UPI0035EDD3AA